MEENKLFVADTARFLHKKHEWRLYIYLFIYYGPLHTQTHTHVIRARVCGLNFLRYSMAELKLIPLLLW